MEDVPQNSIGVVNMSAGIPINEKKYGFISYKVSKPKDAKGSYVQSLL